MQESSEVREAVLRYYERVTAGDVDGAAATIADDPGSFVVGTERTGAGREAWLGSLAAYSDMRLRFEPGPLRAPGFREVIGVLGPARVVVRLPPGIPPHAAGLAGFRISPGQ